MEVFDIFSQSFQFKVGRGESKRKTIWGGILSLLILSTCLLYLLYLLVNFFKRGTPPIISSSKIINREATSVDFRFLDGTESTDYYGENHFYFPLIIRIYIPDCKQKKMPINNNREYIISDRMIFFCSQIIGEIIYRLIFSRDFIILFFPL